MRSLTKHGRYINSRIGKAIDAYDLINNGDKILVAVSGGKDSTTLLSLLKERLRWIPVKYELIACHVKTDFHCGSCAHTKTLTKFFKKLGVKYVFKDVKVLDTKGKTNCFWCSWNKRKALFETADEFKCDKIAFGHHKDDIVETVLMNMIYKGETAAMNPKQELFKGKIVIIRPLCLVEEKFIRLYAKENALTDKLCACPFGADSKRKYVKKLIKDIAKDSPDINVRTNIFNSIARVKGDYVKLESIS
ncbi:MAG: ATP-binding protein [Candidatus Omnitrophota bacterium]|nr:ATP-binding protein [Candidatus Omnitrophota bacterium]